jgi:hypothetical protein
LSVRGQCASWRELVSPQPLSLNSSRSVPWS